MCQSTGKPVDEARSLALLNVLLEDEAGRERLVDALDRCIRMRERTRINIRKIVAASPGLRENNQRRLTEVLRTAAEQTGISIEDYNA